MADPKERLEVLLTQESNIYKTHDYMSRLRAFAASTSSTIVPPCQKKRKALEAEASVTSCSSTSTSNTINRHWREKMCEWAYQVVDHFDLHREVVAVAMSHLDRYLQSYTSAMDKHQFQLLAMTCLCLAIKLFEFKYLMISGSKNTMETILQLSRGSFTLEQMEAMEVDILTRLGWHVHPPTPQLFVKHFLFLSSWDQEVHDRAQFLVELSTIDYFFVSYLPSQVALAALWNALEEDETDANAERAQALCDVCDWDAAALLACRARLALIYTRAASATTTCPKATTVCEDRTISPVSVAAVPPSMPPTYQQQQHQQVDSPSVVVSTYAYHQQEDENLETTDQSGDCVSMSD